MTYYINMIIYLISLSFCCRGLLQLAANALTLVDLLHLPSDGLGVDLSMGASESKPSLETKNVFQKVNLNVSL